MAVTSDDGTTATFGVWRATDLNGFPVRIRSLKGPVAFTLNLGGARSEDLALKLFQPPEGFTKYSSSDSMVGSEIVLRRKSKSKIFRRKNRGSHRLNRIRTEAGLITAVSGALLAGQSRCDFFLCRVRGAWVIHVGKLQRRFERVQRAEARSWLRRIWTWASETSKYHRFSGSS